MIQNKINKIYLPILFAIILAAGIFLGNKLGKNPRYNYAFLNNRNDNLSSVINYIESRYVDTVNRKSLEESAIPALLEKLDPHSVYIPASEMQSVNEDMQGNFDGIGVVFNLLTDTAIIIDVISGGPSDKVGILPGDRIIKVNDSLIAGQKLESDQVVGMLKGLRGTKVNVSIQRTGISDLINFEIIRDKIPLYSVDVAYMVNHEIGFIKINRFAQTTFEEFLTGIDKLRKQNMKKLIVDLRGNTGGYINAAANIADQFLEEGKMIVYTQGKASPKSEIYSTSSGICEDIEVVILQDEWSASASEILSGAIQDNDRGKIIGRRSFGKGLVQEEYHLSDGAVIRLTIARYYTPTGRSIQKPYSDSREDYFNDLNNRFEHGEFEQADSIHFSDSLKYKTPGGNIVYGGGGIMPDIFVPIDTSGFTKYYALVVNKRLTYDFAFDYSDKNRNALSKYKTAQDLNNYLESQKIFDQFVKYAEQKGVPKDTKGLDVSKKIINTQIKAYIARNIIDNEGFYPIIMEIDKTFINAVNYLSNN
ncbi:MAG: peptidase S41 [Bacteroidetes bacterium GWF2_33_16]|nr:MAG: peptidase S41 [Bacteroidetes bacterium GWE2_32_14]OFY07660.1 MAG: peptidase S41 [Bacteroidetes bacterium GWF2_33_16]